MLLWVWEQASRIEHSWFDDVTFGYVSVARTSAGVKVVFARAVAGIFGYISWKIIYLIHGFITI